MTLQVTVPRLLSEAQRPVGVADVRVGGVVVTAPLPGVSVALPP